VERTRWTAVHVALMAAAVLGASAGTAEAKNYCCWRIDVTVAGNLHVDATGQGKNSVSGTFDRTWRWQARELMFYHQRGIRKRSLNQFETRTSYIRGRRRFEAGERSNQTYTDTSDPPQTTAFPPCRYERSVPWRAVSPPMFSLDVWTLGGGSTLSVRSVGPDYEGGCDNSVPHHTAVEAYELRGGGCRPYDLWDMFTVDSGGCMPLRKLRRTKDWSTTFERTKTETLNEDDPRFTQTYTSRVSRITRFTWFPRDGLQAELNRLNALKG
jgi:hypothetical protein